MQVQAKVLVGGCVGGWVGVWVVGWVCGWLDGGLVLSTNMNEHRRTSMNTDNRGKFLEYEDMSGWHRPSLA